jgi:hypothetical protein
MKHKRTIIVISGCVAFLLLFYFFLVRNPSLKNEVSRYDGDGIIEDISGRYLVYPMPGYSITFPLFDLGQPFEDTYSISNLPDLNDVGIYLVVESDSYVGDEERKTLHSKVELTLIDSKGKVALEHNSYLKDMTWMYEHHGVIDGHRLYNLNTTFFSPIKCERYKLHIKYSPDEALAHRKGHVLIRRYGGGS